MTQVLTVRVHSRQDRGVRLWIPLFPVFLILAPLLLLVALVLAVASLVYRANPLRTLGASWRLLTSLRGLNVEVHDGDGSTVLVKVA